MNFYSINQVNFYRTICPYDKGQVEVGVPVRETLKKRVPVTTKLTFLDTRAKDKTDDFIGAGIRVTGRPF